MHVQLANQRDGKARRALLVRNWLIGGDVRKIGARPNNFDPKICYFSFNFHLKTRSYIIPTSMSTALRVGVERGDAWGFLTRTVIEYASKYLQKQSTVKKNLEIDSERGKRTYLARIVYAIVCDNFSSKSTLFPVIILATSLFCMWANAIIRDCERGGFKGAQKCYRVNIRVVYCILQFTRSPCSSTHSTHHTAHSRE